MAVSAEADYTCAHTWGPPVVLLSVCPTETHRNTCTGVFVAELFVIARSWKLRKYPLTERTNKPWLFFFCLFFNTMG